MKKQSSKFNALFLFFFLVIILILLSFIFYNSQLTTSLMSSVERTLSEIVEQQKFNFDSEIKAEVKSIKSLAAFLSFLAPEKAEIILAIEGALSETMFDRITVADSSGIGYTSDGNEVNLSDQPYFSLVIEGQTVISEHKISESGEAFISLATPLYRASAVSGILVGTFGAKRLDKLLLPSFGGKGYAFAIDAQGKIIAITKNDYVLVDKENIFSSLAKAKFSGGSSYATVVNDIENGKSGKTIYTLEGHTRFAQYKPLFVNGWYMFVVIPEEVIASEAEKISISATIMAVLIISGFVLLITYILYQQQRAERAKRAYTTQLEKTAYYDELTGLPNLAKFKIDAKKIITENMKKTFVIAKFDIVNFKMVNELFNFGVGDAIICSIAELVKEVQAAQGLKCGSFARINDDEFIILDPANGNPDEVRDRQILFEQLFNQRSLEIIGTHRIEFRYGRYFLDRGETDISEIIEKANLAHRIAKKQKSDTTCDYNDAFKQRVVREVEIQNKMESAILNREFKVYLQPKYELKNNTICGAEALVRWQQADGSLLPPADFVPLFEKNGFIVKLDMYMFQSVCRFLSDLLAAGMQPVPISVNFSRLHLQNIRFIDEITAISEHYSLPRQLLEIELTETVLFDNMEILSSFFDRLHDAGFRVSMDDFGTGYSSLGLLKNLNVDIIKIDRSFFVDALDEKRSRAVIETIILMAKKLGMFTVAEGVEEKKHIDLLCLLECDAVQGYYFAKPMNEKDFIALLQRSVTATI